MSQDTEEKDLLDQQHAVEDYLSALLLEPEQEQAASVSRTAQKLVGIMAEPASAELECDTDQVKEVPETIGQIEIESAVDCKTIETLADSALDEQVEDEVPDEIALDQSSIMSKQQSESSLQTENDDEDESLEINLEIPDCSDDPEVIAEAEKMLSFVFPQPQAQLNTPLRKLQDAGLIKVVQEEEATDEAQLAGATEATEIASPSRPILAGENAFKNDITVQMIPSFAAERFTVMGFRVSRLSMMVSVTELRNVKKAEGELLPIFGKPSWLLEYRKPEGGTAFVIDGTELFVPDGATKILSTKPEDLYIIWMLDGRVGILCDEIQEMTELNKRQVTWRGSKSQRPWLAGTIRSMRSVLIDGQSLWEMVDSLLKPEVSKVFE